MEHTTKNPAAVALGRLGGKAKSPRKGFGSNPEKARAAALKSWQSRRRSQDSDNGSETSLPTSPESTETERS